ncbi:MAG: class I SAM-dependent methyltransferase [Rubrivivax sp.]|nr:MAG: class I SAM-dependent methyltransferase [Rubrivivax sp.]
MKALRLIALLATEWLSSRTLVRTPESAQMNDAEQVRAFHQAGEHYLQGLYHFNAWAINKMAPSGGLVVDLGSGSAQFLAYLARARPDLRIVGIELAERMVVQGRDFLQSQGLQNRVDLRHGDMTNFFNEMSEPVSVVSSVFSLHHLPTATDLEHCLEQVHKLRTRDGAAFWVFDHARPKAARTAELFPMVFTPEAAPAFNQDSTQSLMASWTLTEMLEKFDSAGLSEGQHLLARLLPLYQVHRLKPLGGHDGGQASLPPLWALPPATGLTAKDSDGLQWLFPTLLS